MPTKPLTFWEGVKEIDRFFEGRDAVHKTMRQIVKRLEKADIPYAVVGGMAVYAHGYRRTTDDLDLLLTPAGFEEFKRLFVPKKYEPHARLSRRFTDRANDVTVDILITGLFPVSGKPGPISYPDPAAVSQTIKKARVIDLVTLIQMKLAARRHQDFADVVNMIRFNDLGESFTERLHPSVRRDYSECLDEKRRDDEYVARNG
jgi:hypothetical protein